MPLLYRVLPRLGCNSRAHAVLFTAYYADCAAPAQLALLIFQHRNAERMRGSSEREPLLKARVADAVVRYRSNSSRLHRGVSLAFEDNETELAFDLFFAQLSEQKTRRRLLALSFSYMLFAVVESRSSELLWSENQRRSLLIARSVFVAVNCTACKCS